MALHLESGFLHLFLEHSGKAPTLWNFWRLFRAVLVALLSPGEEPDWTRPGLCLSQYLSATGVDRRGLTRLYGKHLYPSSSR